MSKPNQLTQGDRVRLIDQDYPGLFVVIEPLNLMFDDENKNWKLVSTIRPLDVALFTKHFCNDAYAGEVELIINPDHLELVTE